MIAKFRSLFEFQAFRRVQCVLIQRLTFRVGTTVCVTFGSWRRSRDHTRSRDRIDGLSHLLVRSKVRDTDLTWRDARARLHPGVPRAPRLLMRIDGRRLFFFRASG